MDKFQKIELSLILIILIVNVFFIISFTGFSILGFTFFESENKNLQTPFDFISEDQIIIEEGKIIISLDNYVLSRYTPSQSMAPVLGQETTGIGFKPNSEDDLHVGDIVSFYQDESLIVHRIIKKEYDEQGIYFITKGDNNNLDDGKIRFSQIDSVLVALVY